jgi:hypothetical protein
MSDYLTSLIQRSRGLAPQVEPLIAPMHAPPSLMLRETLEISSPLEPSSASKTETADEDIPQRVGVKTKPRELTSLPVESPRSQTPFPESAATFPIEKTDLREPTEPQRNARLHRSSSVSPPETADLIAPSQSPSPPKEKTRVVVRPEIATRLKTTAPPVSARPSSPIKPPTIHVTIGRVEVRAVMPPVAAPKPSSPSGPKPSLEDYLKQRNGDRS